jgi:predicted thioesterase
LTLASDDCRYPKWSWRQQPRLQLARQLQVAVSIQHTAATPNNTHVSAKATFLGMKDQLYKFQVKAFDLAGTMGEGKHTHAIIDTTRLMRKAVEPPVGGG